MATLSLSAHRQFTADKYKLYFETGYSSCTQPDSVHRDGEDEEVTADRTAAFKQHNAH